MVGAIPSLRCQGDPACPYPAVTVAGGKLVCAMCGQAAEHPELYARRAAPIFRRVEPAPNRRRYVARPAPALAQPRCLLCGASCGPSALCRAHIGGWRAHNVHHRLDQITPSQYAARRRAC